MIKMKLKIDTSVAWDELLLTFKHWLHSPNFHRAQTACSLDGLPTKFSSREHCARAHTARSAVCGVVGLPHTGSAASPLISPTICLPRVTESDCLVLCGPFF